MKRTKHANHNIAQEPQKRCRNVAHLWTDKRINRFFRKNFDKRHYKNLRLVYSALCEIDSDFGEDKKIGSLMKTLATYAGMDVDTIRPYVRALQKADLIDFWQDNEDGTFGQSHLTLYEWIDSRSDEVRKVMQRVLDNKMESTPHDDRVRKTPLTEKPLNGNTVNGKTRPFKNDNKLSSIYKNPKGNNYHKPASEEIRKEKDNNASNPDSPITQSQFEEFWKLYPRKVDKGRALTVWERICRQNGRKRPTWRQVSTAIIEQKKTDRWKEKKYIPHPTTWLNNQRWLDDPEEMVSYSDSESLSASNTTTAPSQQPEKIIEEYFGKKKELAKFFIRDCYDTSDDITKPDTPEEESVLAHKLITLYDFIAQAQREHFNEALTKLLPGPMAVLENYIHWIGEQHWIQDKSARLFDPKHKLFNKYRRQEANHDNMERDPLTGESYMNTA